MTDTSRQFEWPSANASEPIEVTPTDDPNVVRRLLSSRDATAVAIFVLTGDAATVDAFDITMAAVMPAELRNLPGSVGSAIVRHAEPRHRVAVRAAVDAVAHTFSRTDGSPAMIETAVHHVADAARRAITGSICAELDCGVDEYGRPVLNFDPIWAQAAARAANGAVAAVAARLRVAALRLAACDHE